MRVRACCNSDSKCWICFSGEPASPGLLCWNKPTPSPPTASPITNGNAERRLCVGIILAEVGWGESSVRVSYSRLWTSVAVGKSVGMGRVTRPVAAHSVPRRRVVMKPTHFCEVRSGPLL